MAAEKLPEPEVCALREILETELTLWYETAEGHRVQGRNYTTIRKLLRLRGVEPTVGQDFTFHLLRAGYGLVLGKLWSPAAGRGVGGWMAVVYRREN